MGEDRAMFIVALVIAVPLLALALAVLVRDVRDDGYGHRASGRSGGFTGPDDLPSFGPSSAAARYRTPVLR